MKLIKASHSIKQGINISTPGTSEKETSLHCAKIHHGLQLKRIGCHNMLLSQQHIRPCICALGSLCITGSYIPISAMFLWHLQNKTLAANTKVHTLSSSRYCQPMFHQPYKPTILSLTHPSIPSVLIMLYNSQAATLPNSINPNHSSMYHYSRITHIPLYTTTAYSQYKPT